jgi:uncharacterized protein YwqG
MRDRNDCFAKDVKFSNSKHEIRNSKQIQMTKIQNSKLKSKRNLFGKLNHLNFGIVSDFDIQISDFSGSDGGL